MMWKSLQVEYLRDKGVGHLSHFPSSQTEHSLVILFPSGLLILGEGEKQKENQI